MKKKVECLIEIFDQEHTKENIGACMLYQPDVFYTFCPFGTDERKINGLKNFLHKYCPETELKAINVEVSGTDAVKEEVILHMNQICEKHNEILVEICGGDPLLNIAVFYSCVLRGLPTISIDFEDGIVSNWDSAMEYAGKFEPISLSLDMIVQLNGGCIEKNMHRVPREMDYQLILECAEFILKNPKDYMRFSQYLQNCMRQNELHDALAVKTSNAQVIQNNITVKANEDWFQRMKEFGLIKEVVIEEDEISFVYSSAFAKESLLVTGSWLEMYVYISACLSYEYDEVMESVILDWNGILGEDFDVKNEIDLLLRKGNIPIFISCKMRKINAVDLNEIKQYAQRFGGSEAKAVIITTNEINQRENTIKNRAKEMGVILVDRNDLKLSVTEGFCE
ncbi:MAG: restriction endonuclease [Lachnospiraceae bacterium]|nr:restriction endonuclease [Lachnospiraceae bacterium]